MENFIPAGNGPCARLQRETGLRNVKSGTVQIVYGPAVVIRRNVMKYYLAPLEGITGHVYRNMLEKYFPGADRYFTPFIAPDQNKVLRTKERRDVLPENNRVGELVPQILTNRADHFLMTVRVLEELGYREVNINLGCPSGTVASRGRGAGFLAYPDELDRFLEKIFEGTKLRISVKTRIGKEDVGELLELMRIYQRYPLSELIIHPRTQKEFYRFVPSDELASRFALCREALGGKLSLCYNGNLLTQSDFCSFTEKFPETDSVMLGRGVIANPGLIRQIRTGKQIERSELRAFHDEVLDEYRALFGEDRNAVFHMKEMWIYMIHLFEDSEKYRRKIHKSQSLAEYCAAVDTLFGTCRFLPDGPASWDLPQK